MKTIIELKYAIIALIMTAVCGAGAKASAPWTVNPSDYQYDMSLYLKVEIEGQGPMDYSLYTVAAFCGNECRGIAQVQTHTDGSTWLYLRARSNNPSGETLTYKYYSEETGKIANIENESFDFANLSQVGWPSAPKLITIAPYTPGDVDDNGKINVIDIGLVRKYILKENPAPFIFDAADMDGNGSINVLDIGAIRKIILNQ